MSRAGQPGLPIFHYRKTGNKVFEENCVDLKSPVDGRVAFCIDMHTFWGANKRVKEMRAAVLVFTPIRLLLGLTEITFLLLDNHQRGIVAGQRPKGGISPPNRLELESHVRNAPACRLLCLTDLQ